MPTVPTLAELGYPGANLSSQFGVFAPGGLPAPVLERLNREINIAMQAADIRNRLVATDNVPTGGTPQAFARQVAAESDANQRIIRAVGIRAD